MDKALSKLKMELEKRMFKEYPEEADINIFYGVLEFFMNEIKLKGDEKKE